MNGLRQEVWGWLALASLLLLIALGLAWELWLAPLRPQGSWLVLKVVPLLFAVRGILHGRRYTYQWAMMLILAYFAEGVVRAVSDQGISAILGGVETSLSLCFFFSAMARCQVQSPRGKP